MVKKDKRHPLKMSKSGFSMVSCKNVDPNLYICLLLNEL